MVDKIVYKDTVSRMVDKFVHRDTVSSIEQNVPQNVQSKGYMLIEYSHVEHTQTKQPNNMAQQQQEENCCICLETLNERQVIQPPCMTTCTLSHCGHKYHAGCIIKWHRQSDDCPQCRSPHMACNHTVDEHMAIVEWSAANDAAIQLQDFPPPVAVVLPVLEDVLVAIQDVVPAGETIVEMRRRKKRESSRRHRARLRRQCELGFGHRLRNGTVVGVEELARRAARRHLMGQLRVARRRALAIIV
jgi:hypothetical protein